MHISRALALAAGSFLGTTLLMPSVRKTLLRRGVMDVPNRRSSHAMPTIRGAGIACALGTAGAAAALTRRSGSFTLPALGASLAMAAVGALDDFTGLPAPARLTAQVVTGFALGTLTDRTVGSAMLGASSMPVLVNAINFMDGINGITGMTVVAWATVVLTTQSAEVPRDLAALSGGSAVAFLPWNIPHARVFLGDSGSYFYGAALASSAICARGRTRLHVLAPLVPYLFDTGYTLVRRAFRREPLLDAHRQHLYQRAQSTLAVPHVWMAGGYGLAALAAGLASITLPWPVTALAGVGALAVYAAIVEYLESAAFTVDGSQAMT